MSFQNQVTAQAMRGTNDSPNDTLQAVMERRVSRREMLRNTIAGIPSLVLTTSALSSVAKSSASTQFATRPVSLTFKPIPLSKQDDIIVPEGYAYQVVLRWGDAILPGASDLDMNNQNGTTQAQQFGYNCDFVGYFPLPFYPSNNPNRAILTVNHEYTDPLLMFPGYLAGQPTKDQVDAELAAHGMSFVEIRNQGGAEGWAYVMDSKLNRRITGETLCELTGPAAGHPLLKTSQDGTGKWVRGTLNNCAGGKTPWGTVLTCEENFNQYFANRNSLPAGDVKTSHTRYGLTTGATSRRWENVYSRFNLIAEPNEPFRFGWVVEIDPYNPSSTPKKRTALGRFKHEGATTILAKDGRVVVYSGDDERFDYIYKFVSAGRYNPNDRAANLDLLDHGTLYVAKFNDDGTGEWIPLVHGAGPLTASNGFLNQGDILINTRRAGDVVGATKMDRPEDIEANPHTGKVYSLMTNNTSRTLAQIDAANPRANNIWGHVIEQTEAGGDNAATSFNWEIFIKCGDPAVDAHDTYFAGYDPSRVSPISAPDNLVFDGNGDCWIATDGLQNGLAGNDGVFAVPVEGPERGYLRQFMSCPVEAEICGPEFNPDYTTLFVAIQHPGEGSRSTNPADLRSTWPDGGVPKPSVVAVVKTAPGNRRIGS